MGRRKDPKLLQREEEDDSSDTSPQHTPCTTIDDESGVEMQPAPLPMEPAAASFSTAAKPPSIPSPPPPPQPALLDSDLLDQSPRRTHRLRKIWANSTTRIIIMSVLGVVVGIGVHASEPSDLTVRWIGFPGQLFLRALKCIVIPMIFCNMVVGVAEISTLGQTGAIGWRTFVLYMSTTIVACVEGLVMVMMFRRFFHVTETDSANSPTYLSFKCDAQSTLTVENGSLTCRADSLAPTPLALQVTQITGSLFQLNTPTKRDVSDTVMGIFNSLVPENIFVAMMTPDVLSVIAFAIAFGIIAAKIKTPEGEGNRVLELVDHLNLLLQDAVRIVVSVAPGAVFFMIAGALAAATDFSGLFQNIGILIVVVIVGHLCHALVALPSLFFFFVRQNPYRYMRQIFEAYTFAFGCASSAATLPVTMRCVEATSEVPQTVSRFVLSLGATVNMDGSAIYFPAAMIFLADVSGNGDLIDVGSLVLIGLVSTLGAVGASPIPNAGLVMIITIWDAVFKGQSIPEQVAFLQAIDWLLDRSVTVVNVCGDSIVARIVAKMMGDTILQPIAQPQKLEPTVASVEQRTAQQRA